MLASDAYLHVYLSLSQMSERLLDVENEAMLKIVELEKQLMQTNKELDHVRVSVVAMETTQAFGQHRNRTPDTVYNETNETF